MKQQETSDEQPSAIEIVLSLFKETRDPSRLLELYYWSQEPEALESLRFQMQMHAKARKALRAFQAAVNPSHVCVEMQQAGTLTLFCAEEAQAVDLSRKSLEKSRRQRAS